MPVDSVQNLATSEIIMISYLMNWVGRLNKIAQISVY